MTRGLDDTDREEWHALALSLAAALQVIATGDATRKEARGLALDALAAAGLSPMHEALRVGALAIARRLPSRAIRSSGSACGSRSLSMNSPRPMLGPCSRRCGPCSKRCARALATR
jgi:hypothetical protein